MSNEKTLPLIHKIQQLKEALKWSLEWIDAVPENVASSLPTMPGFDRDYVEGLLTENIEIKDET